MFWKTYMTGLVVLVLAVPGVTLGQSYDCMVDYVGAGINSQEGDGLHREAYQPNVEPAPVTPYLVTDLTVIVSATHRPDGDLQFLDLVGREVVLRGLFGAYDPVTDPVDGFIPDPTEEPYEHVFTIDETMLAEASEASYLWELSLPNTGHVFPAGKHLNLSVVASVNWDPNEEQFSVCESQTCSVLPEGWFRILSPTPAHGWIVDISAFDNGRIAMRYNIEPVEAVPAVSTWGLVSMALLTLIAGTLVYARRGLVRNAA